MHICLGTFVLGVPGPLGRAGTFDEAVMNQLLSEIEADVFLIEYTQRSGGLESLRAVPKGKVISLGILNIRDPRVETLEEIMRAVDAASRYVPVENLSRCPNCGFYGSAADAFVTEDIEKRKLAVLAEAARRVWG
jgi:5-methyltetrahydropteroyltriglutamate--homocysteine methyltransferase